MDWIQKRRIYFILKIIENSDDLLLYVMAVTSIRVTILKPGMNNTNPFIMSPLTLFFLMIMLSVTMAGAYPNLAATATATATAPPISSSSSSSSS